LMNYIKILQQMTHKRVTDNYGSIPRLL